MAESPKSDETFTADCGKLNLLELNDDCLLEIFKWVELAEQVRLAFLCRRLRNVFQYYCQRHCKVLRKSDLDNMKRREIKYFFEIAGEYLQKLINLPYKDNERNDWVTWVNEFCVNVEKIYFSHTKIKSKCLRKILANMHNITTIELINCSLDDKAMLGVGELSALERLWIISEPKVTGCHLSKMKNLKELKLSRCNNMQDNHLIEICKSSQQLRKLEIIWCQSLTKVAILKLPECCPELLDLKMYNAARVDMTPLARLPKLVSLEIAEDYNSELAEQLLNALACHKKEQLEHLRLHARRIYIDDYVGRITQLKKLKLLTLDRSKYLSCEALESLSSLENLETISLRYCRYITDSAVLTLLNGCKKLKYMNLMYCSLISERLVFDVIKLLREQYSKKERMSCDLPVLILVAGTQIDKTILENPFYLDATELVLLNFINPFRYDSEAKYSFPMPNYGALKYFYTEFEQ